MRITPVNMFRANAKKPQNVSFGKIEEANREKIIENLPVEASNEEDRKLYKQWDVDDLDCNNGVMIKWGGEGHPRGLIYADLIMEHVEKSAFRDDYLKMTHEYWANRENKFMEQYFPTLNNLQDKENYKKFINTIGAINAYGQPDGSRREINYNSSTDSEYKPDREERMWDLYGTRL